MDRPSSDHPVANPQKAAIIAARSLVWNTTELLTQVLSWLPIRNLLVASSVSWRFHDCVFETPGLQAKLFLRASDKVPQTWYVVTQEGWNAQEEVLEHIESLEIAPTVGLKAGYAITTLSLRPSELCPLLRLPDGRLPKLIDRLRMEPHTEYAKFVVQPDHQLGRFNDMLLTDPPLKEAHAHLHYKHSSSPFITMDAARTVRSDSSLTIGELVNSTVRMAGFVSLGEKAAGPHGPYTLRSGQQNISLEAAAFHCTQSIGGRFLLDLEKSTVGFQNIAIASNYEWAKMKIKRAAAEEELKASADTTD